ncbi:DUF1266 domain-containing protein [Streptomyces sp. NPDC058247]|uniref:DUF1266 domain-containing protein n=1 Tax=Streptomyces sp. NPDC058247 TaxID=3346401 RepID=UPI0036EAF548
MLPAPGPEPVYSRGTLDWIACSWKPTDPPSIVINPGSPCEAVLPFGPPNSTEWSRVAASVGTVPINTCSCGACESAALCTAPSPTASPAAPSCVSAMAPCGTPWPGTAAATPRSAGGCASGGHHHPCGVAVRAPPTTGLRIPQLRLGLRPRVAAHHRPGLRRPRRPRLLAPVGGQRAARQYRWGHRPHRGRHHEDRPPAPSPRPRRGSRACSGPSGASAGTRHARADGILGEGRYVRSLDAWDLGRASKMARWGLGARFGTIEEAESVVVQAGRNAMLSYRSWQEFSAGYILGRCLHFDEEEFGDWYEDMVSTHRILMSDAGSPWLNIPFQ